MFFELIVLAASGFTAPEIEPEVVGAPTAAACEWPATVRLSGCSGTLIHPEIVMYAAHCPPSGSASFGTTGSERSVGIEYCRAAPEYPALGFDYAYCKLEQPVTDVPIAPVLTGCERDQLEVGRRVSLVGYGQPGFGTKRWVEGEIAGFPDDGRKIGVFYDSPDEGICNGDSGGSGYVQLDDGTWRTWGINSTIAPPCGGSSQHIPSWVAAEWIEQDSGIDITPCTDADGTWNPTEACTGLPLAPGDEEGLRWTTGCGPGARSGSSRVCGPAFGEPADAVAPTLNITAPATGEYAGPEFQARIELTAADDYAIRDVVLEFGGETQAIFEGPGPYALESVTFLEGTWDIRGTVRDWSGNASEQTVTVVVGDPDANGGSTGGVDPQGTSGGGTGATSSPSQTTAGDTGGPGPAGDSEGTPMGESTAGSSSGDSGCRVAASSPAAGRCAALAMLLLLGRLRRRGPGMLA